ncbi:prepilin-type N-terminal cleavage/methylation domain-containing protein [Terrimicrobium sacchariphilum]|uniref:Prepilin-type N-terminal cleavage/methylation domain-containing protein n=1 Tax=Terrimicrobium sacchariphilum TaxID=690879 RepID=A0A146G675_TERSA|nr:prepilin-type N-terminal cleavage/methylation domain-containing protein [Terrimicrobium sacchariphilum]GAT32883.1 prepilin-type N-terminal cleavage/methylation domain-containing protein [Terrimicrobium sacchariphilum]
MKAAGWIRLFLLAGFAGLTVLSRAVEPTVYSVISSNDAFLATGSPDNPNTGGDNVDHDLTDWNYGDAGTLVIASGNSSYVDPASGRTIRKGEFQSVIMFSSAGAITLFDATYGAGHWFVTSISLSFASNWAEAGSIPNNPIFGMIQGGKFVIEWLSDDDWEQGSGSPSSPTQDGVTYDSLSTLLTSEHEVLGSYTYDPPGNGIRLTWNLPLTDNLVSDVTAGGAISFLMYAGDDNIDYLFSSSRYGHDNEPKIIITAIPEPSVLGFAALGGLIIVGRRIRRAAFTLPEVLVAISLVAIAASVTTNWVNTGIEKARGAECVGHLQQWGVALQLYIQDHDGFLPRRGQGVRPVTVIDRDEDWFNCLPPYLEMSPYKELYAHGQAPRPGLRSIFLCPGAKIPEDCVHFISYGMNMYLSRWDQRDASRVVQLPRPSSLAFLADSPGGYASTVPSRSEYSVVPRHSGGANVVFLDGHVQRFTGTYLGCGTGDLSQPDVRWKTEIPGDTWKPNL